jgi:hypothetical protein
MKPRCTHNPENECREQVTVAEQLRASVMYETLQGIANANWREWDEMVRSPEQFVLWAQNQARWALQKADGK